MEGGNDNNNSWEVCQTFQKVKNKTKSLSGTETKSEVLMGRIYRLTELTLWAKEKALAQGGQNKISYKEQVPKVLVWKLSLSCKLGRSNKMSEKKGLSHERKKAKELMIDNEKKKTFGKLSTQKYINTI